MPKRGWYVSFIVIFMLISIRSNVIAIPLGTQSFPHINFSDDTITQAEIEVVSTDVEKPAILPNNALYPVKKLKEKFILLITTNKEKRAELYLKHAQIRLAEAHALIEQKESKNQLIYEIIQEKADKKESISTNKSEEIKDKKNITKHEKKYETNKTKKSAKEIAITVIVNQSITGKAILENKDTQSREEKSGDKKTKEKEEVTIQKKKDMIEKAKTDVEIAKPKKEEMPIQKPKDISEKSKRDVVVNISKDKKVKI